jgi:hypothetical protein
MRCGFLAVALVLAAAAPALAQNAPELPGTLPAPTASSDPERFKAYIGSQGYQGFLGQIAMNGESISAPECKQPKLISHSVVAMFALPSFGEGVHPHAGAWLDRVTMDRCGTQVFQNIAMRASPENKPPAAALMLPGETGTTPNKQGEVIADLITAFAKAKCNDPSKIIPVNTKVEKAAKPLKLDEQGRLIEGNWKETWSFNACGKPAKATIEFTADGKGGLAHKVKL